MADSALLNETARVLKLVQAGTPADAALRETLGRTRHSSAPALRRAVSRAVFAYFRWLRWLEPKQSLQKQAQAALDLQARFDRAPDSFKPEALAARAVPDWLKSEMDVPPDWLRQLQREPILWLRAKANDSLAGSSIAEHLVTVSLSDYRAESSLTAGIYLGQRDLFLTDEFRDGRFEIQDLASQLVGHACAPQPGQTWWDACAGEGGKTLHLSDLMQNKGLLWASDRSLRRLDHLKKRASRAGAFNYRAAPWDGSAKLPTKTKFDGVLVDAPCSGIGTWQRNPHARWTTQPSDIHELAAVQAKLLDHVAGSLKPGGRLVYAVCTLARAETTAIAEAFTAAHADFEPAPVFSSSQLSALSSQLFLHPHELNANGMFIAAWRRK
ncbi:MAG: RsmB/NOP family class I SAM-dependent RNA methyltransferase [Opitutae bacterium]|nr:RsmB/NOP family class I SAM-dependent RNA methyltransferase [Opitutae bacterium]